MSLSRKVTSLIAALVLAIAGLVATAPVTGTASAGSDRGPTWVEPRVEQVQAHQQLGQEAARVRDARRACSSTSARSPGSPTATAATARPGTPGYDASVEVRREAARSAPATASRSRSSTFFAFSELGASELEQITPTPTAYVEDVDFAATPQSEPGDVTAAVTPVDVQLGLGNTSTSGCEAADFTGFPAGNIALLQRGTCTFEIKGENAAAAGAIGVLFFNQGNTAAAGPAGHPRRHARQRLHRRHPGARARRTRSVRSSPASPGLHDAAVREREPGRVGHQQRPRRVHGEGRLQRGHGRRAPRLGAGGPRHQRQRLGLVGPARGRGAARAR